MKREYRIISAHREMRGLEYLLYSAFSLTLLMVLVFLPLAPVFANEISVENTPDSPSDAEPITPLPENPPGDSTVDTTTQDTQSPATEPESALGTVPSDTPPQTVDEPEATLSETTTDTIADTEVEGGLVFSTDDTPIDENADTSPTAETDAVTTEDSETTDPVLGEEVIENEVDITPNEESATISEVADVQATGTSDTIEENVVTAITNDENKFTFSKDECTTVGNGTFYCATPQDAPQVLHTDRIFSALDEEGDKEIYIEKDGELSALTKNTADDDAPYFDEVSNTAVWQRLIDGRYQIIQYDFDEESEKQLTYDSFNNMQPSAFGDAVVWQGWVGSDWEIFMSIQGTVTMLTDNTIHDIAPSVNGTHIVWQSFENDTWVVKVYDLRTGLIDTVQDVGGGSIENPRFVLVYDAKMETGDIETRGYDLKSGEVLDLASKPTSVPEDIPDPDQTGEKRALVTSSTQPKQKANTDENDDVGTTTDNGIDDGDLVIPALTDGVVSTSTPEINIETEDIVIPSYSEGTTTSEVGTIEDLIVEPYVPLEEVLEEEV